MKVKFRTLLFCSIALLSSFFVQAQGRTVYGVVNDHNGNVLSDVDVMLKGTSFGTKTNLLGAFAMTAPTSSFTLIVSYIGCKTLEITVGDKNEYLIELDCRGTEQNLSKKKVITKISNKEKLNDEAQ